MTIVAGNIEETTEETLHQLGSKFPTSHLQSGFPNVTNCATCHRLVSPLISMSQHACGCEMPVKVCSSVCLQHHLTNVHNAS